MYSETIDSCVLSSAPTSRVVKLQEQHMNQECNSRQQNNVKLHSPGLARGHCYPETCSLIPNTSQTNTLVLYTATHPRFSVGDFVTDNKRVNELYICRW
jgi:hypothetical protein